MKTSVKSTVSVHVELTKEDLVEAITEFCKQRTPRLMTRKPTGLLRMDNIRITAQTVNGDSLDITDISDIDHVDFVCEVKR